MAPVIPRQNLITGAIEGIAQVPGIIEAGKGFRQTDKERLAELERRAAMGTLGLTPAEQDVLRTQLLSPAQALAGQQMLEQRALQAATGGAGGGADFGQMMARQEAEQRRIAEAQAKIAADDVRLQLQQEEEARDLGRAADEAQARRRAAILGGIGAVGAELFGLGLEGQRLRELTGMRRQSAQGRIESDYTKGFLED